VLVLVNELQFLLIQHVHCYRLDTHVFTSYGLAWSASVNALPHSEFCFVLSSDTVLS